MSDRSWLISLRSHAIGGYVVGALVTAMVVAVRLALVPVIDYESPLVLFVLPVIAAAWWGGWKPGLATTLLAMLVVSFVFFEPRGSLEIGRPSDQIRALVFVIVSVICTAICQALHNARQLAESRERELESQLALRRDVENALRANDAQQRTLIELAPRLVWMARPDGYVTYCNSYWQQLTGMTNEQSVGAGGFAAIHPDDRERVREHWKKHIQSTDDWEIELRLYDAASRGYRWHINRARAAVDGAGQIQHWIGTAVDIEALKRAERELRRLNEELELRVGHRTAALENANRELEAFSYSVSHDLRAPLRAIDGFSRILAEEHAAELSPEARRLLSVVCDNVRRMGALIDDLLAYSRLSRQSLRRQTIDMNELVASIAADQRAGWGERSVEVKVGNLPACVGDPALLRQVWTNLLANAVKFTRKGQGAVIEIGSRIEPAFPGSYTYWIRDNGVGFDMKYAGKLFGVFQRLHPQTEFEGTGVGLAIVENIVRRHGGQVRAEGKVGEGATFFVSLPAGD